jgi:hypothetical protein
MTASIAAIGGFALSQSPVRVASVRLDVGNLPPYGNSTLPTGIVNNVNVLAIHMLEAGFETKQRPCILLLHGFPKPPKSCGGASQTGGDLSR